MSKKVVDQDDQDMREGLAILQVLVMKAVPTAVNGSWSPLLKKVAAWKPAAEAIAEFLLVPFSKRDLQEEVQLLLAENIATLTPSTVWYLESDAFKKAKAQQRLRLKVTFCVHDRFEGNIGNLINLAATIKSPEELVDVFLHAVVKTKSPLSSDTVRRRYIECLKHIQGTAELKQVSGHYLTQWPALLFRRNPIDAGRTRSEYLEQLIAANRDAAGIDESNSDSGKSNCPTGKDHDGFFHQQKPRPFEN